MWLMTFAQLIKKLSATPTLAAQNDVSRSAASADSQASLQANKATFFFQLVCTSHDSHHEHPFKLTDSRTGTRTRQGQCFLFAERRRGSLSLLACQIRMRLRIFAAQNQIKNTARQEEGPTNERRRIKAICQVHNP